MTFEISTLGNFAFQFHTTCQNSQIYGLEYMFYSRYNLSWWSRSGCRRTKQLRNHTNHLHGHVPPSDDPLHYFTFNNYHFFFIIVPWSNSNYKTKVVEKRTNQKSSSGWWCSTFIYFMHLLIWSSSLCHTFVWLNELEC